MFGLVEIDMAEFQTKVRFVLTFDGLQRKKVAVLFGLWLSVDDALSAWICLLGPNFLHLEIPVECLEFPRSSNSETLNLGWLL